MPSALSTSYIKTESYSKYYLILFILWPFLAFLVALANFSQKEAKRVVYFFFIYFGLTLIIDIGFYFDAMGYAFRLEQNASLPFSDFFKMVGGMYATDTSVDIFEPFISFLISRFTDNHRILFAVFAAIFGFFYLRSINLLYRRYIENPGLNAALHMAFFSTVLTITSISGFRMWTAAWIFFYGAYFAILQHNYRYLILAILSSFVHWSFLSASLVLLIYFFAGNRNSIYYSLAAISFVVPQLFSSLFQTVSLRMGGAIQGRYESYASEDYINFRQADVDQASWFLQIGNNLVFYYLILAILFIKFKFGSQMQEKHEKNLFSFILLFLAFVNFGKVIPSFGDRFQLVFFLFATLYIFLYFAKQSQQKISPLTIVGAFPMMLYVMVLFRQVSEFTSFMLFAPGFGTPFLMPDISIAEFLF